MAVADDARVGRQSLLIGSHEALDNVAVEGLLQVEHVVGYPQALGDGLCIGDVAVDFAHARDGIGRGTGEAHGGTDAFVALALEQVAVTLESTPPLMATSTRLLCMGRFSLVHVAKKEKRRGSWFRAADIVASSDDSWSA